MRLGWMELTVRGCFLLPKVQVPVKFRCDLLAPVLRINRIVQSKIEPLVGTSRLVITVKRNPYF